MAERIPAAHLKLVEIENFKTFQHRVVPICGQSISVMGPNGSGKSNFMDAVGFALGAKPSMLRANHLAEVIHGDVFNKLDVKSATVSLIFTRCSAVEQTSGPEETAPIVTSIHDGAPVPRVVSVSQLIEEDWNSSASLNSKDGAECPVDGRTAALHQVEQTVTQLDGMDVDTNEHSIIQSSGMDDDSIEHRIIQLDGMNDDSMRYQTEQQDRNYSLFDDNEFPPFPPPPSPESDIELNISSTTPPSVLDEYDSFNSEEASGVDFDLYAREHEIVPISGGTMDTDSHWDASSSELRDVNSNPIDSTQLMCPEVIAPTPPDFDTSPSSNEDTNCFEFRDQTYPILTEEALFFFKSIFSDTRLMSDCFSLMLEETDPVPYVYTQARYQRDLTFFGRAFAKSMAKPYMNNQTPRFSGRFGHMVNIAGYYRDQLDEIELEKYRLREENLDINNPPPRVPSRLECVLAIVERHMPRNLEVNSSSPRKITALRTSRIPRSAYRYSDDHYEIDRATYGEEFASSMLRDYMNNQHQLRFHCRLEHILNRPSRNGNDAFNHYLRKSVPLLQTSNQEDSSETSQITSSSQQDSSPAHELSSTVEIQIEGHSNDSSSDHSGSTHSNQIEGDSHDSDSEHSDSTHSSDFFSQRNVNQPPEHNRPMDTADIADSNTPGVNQGTDERCVVREPLEGELIKFTRTVKRNGNGRRVVNVYLINDEEVTTERYNKALAEIGINTRYNLFLIFQGRIEEIATKTPRELLDIFEHLSGSIEYKAEYNRLKEKLETGKDRAKEIVYNLRSLKKEKKYYAGVVQTDALYHKMELECIEAQLVHALFGLRANENIYHSEMKELEKLEQEQKSNQDDLNEKSSLWATEKEKQDVLQQEITSCSDSINMRMAPELEASRLAEIRATTTYNEQMRKKQQISSLLKDAVTAHTSREDAIKDLRRNLVRLKEEYAKKRQEFEDIEDKLKSFGYDQIREYGTLKCEFDRRVAPLVSQLESLERAKHAEEEKFELIKRQNEKRNDQCLASRSREQKIQENMSQCAVLLSDKESEAASMEATFHLYRTKAQELTTKLAELNVKISAVKDAESDRKKREHRQATMTSLQEKFGKEKVIGRIRDLINVSHPIYNLAYWRIVEPHQYKIVVDCEQTAVECINYLRSWQLGFETFLPLDLAKTRKLVKSYRTLGQKFNRKLRLLYDVLQYDPIIDPAVIWISNNTLICENADDAGFVAFETDSNEYRNAVALDGTFYSSSGLIHGGNASRLASSFHSASLASLKENRAQIQEELKKCHEASDDFQLSLSKVEIAAIKKRMSMFQRELTLEQSKYHSLLGKPPGQAEDTGKIADALDKLTVDIQKLQDEMKKIENDVFAEFCTMVGVESVAIFEESQMSHFKKRKSELLEIKNTINLAQNELAYEQSRNTEKKVIEVNTEYEKTCAELEKIKETMEEEKRQSELLEDLIEIDEGKIRHKREEMKKVKVELEKALGLVKSSKSEVLRVEKKCEQARAKIEQLKTGRYKLLQKARYKLLDLPLLRGDLKSLETSDEDYELRVNNIFADYAIDYSLLEEKDLLAVEAYICEDVQVALKNTMEEKLRQVSNYRTAKGDELNQIATINLRISQLVKLQSELTKEKKTLQDNFSAVKKSRIQKLQAMFDFMHDHCDLTYKALTQTQGIVYLDILNCDEVFDTGIMFSAQPCGRAYVDTMSLSGGERTMASLALIFAMWQFKPSPFILFDEIDAALDLQNILKVHQYLRSLVNITAITVTHKPQYYGQSDVLLGITSKTSNTDCQLSQLFTVDLRCRKKNTSEPQGKTTSKPDDETTSNAGDETTSKPDKITSQCDEADKATSQSADKATSQFADEATSQSADEATSQSADEATSQSADKATSQSADEATSQSADKATSQSADEATSQSADKATSQSADEATSQSADKATSQFADEATSQSADEATSQSADKTSQSADEATSQSADEATSQSADEATSQSADKATSQFADEATSQSADEATSQSADEATSQSADKTSQSADEATSQSANEATSQSQNETTSQSQGDGTSQSEEQASSHSPGEAFSRSQYETSSQGEASSQSQGEASSQSQGEASSQSQGEASSQSQVEASSQSQGEASSQSQGEVSSQSQGEASSQSQGHDTTEPPCKRAKI